MTMQKITCLMECSVDGRIDESRWSVLFDKTGEGQIDVYNETLASINPEVCLIGRSAVFRHHCNKKFCNSSFTKINKAKPFLGIRKHGRIAAVFDPKGTIAYENNNIFGNDLLVVLGYDSASEEYLEFLRQKEISYTFAGADGYQLKEALSSLYSDFGLKNVLLCGGGVLNGSFLKQSLIDELYIVLYPGLDGLSGVSSIFEYKGNSDELPCKGQSLELISCEALRAGVVRLRYRFHYYTLENQTKIGN